MARGVQEGLPLFRQRQPRASARHRRLPRDAPRQDQGPALQRWRDLRRDQRERPRSRCVRHPADVQPRERSRDGAAHHRGHAPACLGGDDHGGHPVLRVRSPGPQGRAAHAHHGEARRRPDRVGGRRSRRLDRPARRADPGVLQHPLRSPLRHAGDARGLPEEELRFFRGRRVARRRRRRARARLLEAPQREPRDHRQAP